MRKEKKAGLQSSKDEFITQFRSKPYRDSKNRAKEVDCSEKLRRLALKLRILYGKK